jgi:hypothetical protein
MRRGVNIRFITVGVLVGRSWHVHRRHHGVGRVGIGAGGHVGRRHGVRVHVRRHVVGHHWHRWVHVGRVVGRRRIAVLPVGGILEIGVVLVRGEGGVCFFVRKIGFLFFLFSVMFIFLSLSRPIAIVGVVMVLTGFVV